MLEQNDRIGHAQKCQSGLIEFNLWVILSLNKFMPRAMQQSRILAMFMISVVLDWNENKTALQKGYQKGVGTEVEK